MESDSERKWSSLFFGHAREMETGCLHSLSSWRKSAAFEWAVCSLCHTLISAAMFDPAVKSHVYCMDC